MLCLKQFCEVFYIRISWGHCFLVGLVASAKPIEMERQSVQPIWTDWRSEQMGPQKILKKPFKGQAHPKTNYEGDSSNLLEFP